MADARRHPAGHDRSAERHARKLARRHQDVAGTPLSPVMQTAVTACELAHRPAQRDAPDRDSEEPAADQLKLNSTRDGQV